MGFLAGVETADFRVRPPQLVASFNPAPSTAVHATRGNNPTYALKRLKRDRPDLAEKVVAGAVFLAPELSALQTVRGRNWITVFIDKIPLRANQLST
jgi:hypothetical protein